MDALNLELKIAREDSAGAVETIVCLQDERDEALKRVAVLDQESEGLGHSSGANGASASLKEAQRECTELRAQVAGLEADLVEAQSRRGSSNLASPVSPGRPASMLLALDSGTNLDEEIDSLKAEISSLKEQNSDALEAVLAITDERNDAEQKLLAAMQADDSANSGDVAALQEQLDELNDSMEQLQTERDAARRETLDSLQQLDVLRSAPPPVPASLDDSASAGEVADLKEQLSDAMEAVTAIAEERDAAAAERNALQQQLEIHQSEEERAIAAEAKEVEAEARQVEEAQLAADEAQERVRVAERQAAVAKRQEAALAAEREAAAEAREQEAVAAAKEADDQQRREDAIKQMEREKAESREEAPPPPVARKIKAPLPIPTEGTDLDASGDPPIQPVVIRRYVDSTRESFLVTGAGSRMRGATLLQQGWQR